MMPRSRGKDQVRIVLALPDLAGYPEGGGHWSVFIQYVLGLLDCGCDVYALETMASTGDAARDGQFIRTSLDRWTRYGFAGRYAVLLHQPSDRHPTLETVELFGLSMPDLKVIMKTADLLWNFCAALQQPLLSLFQRRVLVDLDPGILQISALDWDLCLQDHDVFLTVGLKMGDPDCEVPSLDQPWRTFVPFVYVPWWEVERPPGSGAPFTSITQWTWEEQWLGDRVLKSSKRDAYLRYLDLPHRARRPFELAANIDPLDETGDRETLLAHGWRLVHAHDVASSPEAYREYISRSRAEISCAKPIYRELRTGWLSDRSVAYLASGRPVLAEDTGFSDHLPAGEGLLTFRSMEEAVAGAAEIDGHYSHHSKAARALAEECFGSRRTLRAMLSACGL